MKLSGSITAEQWDALFDELDVDKNGTLSYSEFWAKAAIKNSLNLVEALNQFDVSKMMEKTDLRVWALSNDFSNDFTCTNDTTRQYL